MYGRIRQIHFVGIGGIGMSGIAEVLLNLEYGVSGSDLRTSETTERLAALGGTIYIGHRAEQVADADVVVTSTAVQEENPEVVEARRLHIPVIPRAEMLAELMRMKYGVAVAGTHGKTTTTSMVATLLVNGGVDPTAVIGGRLDAFGSNAKLGQGKFLVAEADESDGSFLHLTPTIAIVTNIDADHLDYYSGLDEIKQVFVDFVNKVPFYGTAVLCLDDQNVQEIIPQIKKRYTTYGLNSQADYQATDLSFAGDTTGFTVHYQGQRLGDISIQMPGEHNVLNALAAIAVGRELGLPFEVLQQGFSGFGGVGRRFQHRYDGTVMVIDDYGHHPTEIKATLAAAKNGWDRRVVAVFQPHRFSRTQALFGDFVTAFNQADAVIVTDIYAAGEQPIEGASGQALAEGIAAHGHRDSRFISGLDEVTETLKQTLKADDILITLGAGNVWQVAQNLSEYFQQEAGG